MYQVNPAGDVVMAMGNGPALCGFEVSSLPCTLAFFFTFDHSPKMVFLRGLRFVIGKGIQFWDSVWVPKGTERPPEIQSRLNKAASIFSIYQFEWCPFCVKVRRALKRLNVTVEFKDAKNNAAHADELIRFGGQLQVPCLRVTRPGEAVEWIYESDSIIKYLEEWALKSEKS